MTSSSPIVKKILYAGNKNIDFNVGTKVHFHFQTKICDDEMKIIDDSRKMGQGKPIELIIGKKFKMEVWESLLRGMKLNEVSQFTVDKNLVMQYPFVSKTLRDSHKSVEERMNTHCCALTLQTEGIGYNDLNQLIRQPVDLEFTMEIVRVEQPEDYEKETWQLNENELIDLIPKLRAEGNEQYKNKKFKEASELYAKAIGILEQLMVKEKPHDDDWNKLNEQKMPILLNYAQCLYNIGDFYGTIEHCNTVLKSFDNNVKAYYRRGKAHVAAWNPEKAKEDFLKVAELDPSMETIVRKELNTLEELIRKKDCADKEKFKNMFS